MYKYEYVVVTKTGDTHEILGYTHNIGWCVEVARFCTTIVVCSTSVIEQSASWTKKYDFTLIRNMLQLVNEISNRKKPHVLMRCSVWPLV